MPAGTGQRRWACVMNKVAAPSWLAKTTAARFPANGSQNTAAHLGCWRALWARTCQCATAAPGVGQLIDTMMASRKPAAGTAGHVNLNDSVCGQQSSHQVACAAVQHRHLPSHLPSGRLCLKRYFLTFSLQAPDQATEQVVSQGLKSTVAYCVQAGLVSCCSGARADVLLLSFSQGPTCLASFASS